MTALRDRGRSPGPTWHGAVARTSTGYPPSRVDGAGFTHVLVAEYCTIFATSVEAFYVFDRVGRLADISVRKTVDAL